MTLLLLVLTVLVQASGSALAQSSAAVFEQRTFKAPDGTTVLYGLAVPRGYDARQPRPLVLALHPGGGGTPYYGDQFLRGIFLPGLRELDPIMVAPDSPTRSWTDPVSEQAVMALLDAMIGEYAIDRQRILVVGFSLGGRGAWSLPARHPDRFTAAIVMAARSDEPPERLARVPTYVIHSRHDEVAPFAPAMRLAGDLERMGRTITFDAVAGVRHHDMAGYLDALQRGGRWVIEQWKK
jgi:predicted peptidase